MGLKVLIVDDSATVRMCFKKTLGMTSLEIDQVYEASNGELAMEQLSKNQVDLIILDFNMPKMDGETFLKNIKQDPAHSSTIVIVVTADGSTERQNAFRNLGVNAFFQKPITPEQLAEVVEDYVVTNK